MLELQHILAQNATVLTPCTATIGDFCVTASVVEGSCFPPVLFYSSSHDNTVSLQVCRIGAYRNKVLLVFLVATP